jgi:hypothetical protein
MVPMKRIALLLLVLAGATAAHAGTTAAQRFAATVDTILAQPYQPNYVPLGFDAADRPVLNAAPAQDCAQRSAPLLPRRTLLEKADHDVKPRAGGATAGAGSAA